MSSPRPKPQASGPESFSQRVIAWQRQHGRHDLPWQNTRDAYRVWVSEIMLQQTQVATVIPYFLKFTAEFGNVSELAQAPLERVLQHWSGLGYYSRARNLHRCAQQVVERFGSVFPSDLQALESLPGIGRSTAAAIAALAFGVPAAILDGNVKRVMARHFGIAGYPGDSPVQKQLWAVAQRERPIESIEPYTQGLMDLGASLCSRTRPQCERCPVQASCVALAQNSVSTIPGKKPRTSSPKRFCAVLLIELNRHFLLLRRPPTGIWGGLWSLPEFAIAASEFSAGELTPRTRALISAWLIDNNLHVPGAASLGLVAIAPIEHQFTHFRLGIQPWRIRLQPSQGTLAINAAEPGAVWMPMDDVLGAALPKPVKTLLLRESFSQKTAR